MLRYLAIAGLFACSTVSSLQSTAFGDEPKLQIRAAGSVTGDGEATQVQGKFTTKSGSKLSLAVHNSVETKFEFTVKPVDRTDIAAYTIDIVITRDGKIISRPTVQTLEGYEAKVQIGGEKSSSEFSITIEPAK